MEREVRRGRSQCLGTTLPAPYARALAAYRDGTLAVEGGGMAESEKDMEQLRRGRSGMARIASNATLSNPNSEAMSGSQDGGNNAEAQPSFGSDIEAVGIEEAEDAQLTEDELRLKQKMNSILTISNLRIKPVAKSRMRIPLCRMVYMPMVRPTLD